MVGDCWVLFGGLVDGVSALVVLMPLLRAGCLVCGCAVYCDGCVWLLVVVYVLFGCSVCCFLVGLVSDFASLLLFGWLLSISWFGC